MKKLSPISQYVSQTEVLAVDSVSISSLLAIKITSE